MITKTDMREIDPPRLHMGDGRPPRILIIEARYYSQIADALLLGAREELKSNAADFDCITVPGALEIPLALAGAVADGVIPGSSDLGTYAGAVVLGCVIRGETAHFDIVANNANHWLMDIAVRHAIPVGNAILTVETEAQALQRASGGRDSKGAQAVRACLTLIAHAHQRQSASS